METVSVCELLIFFVLVSINIVYCLQEGEACFHNRRSVNGECEILENCANAIEDLKLRLFPQTCGFVGRRVLVCCPQETITTTTTTTPKPTTTAKPREIGERSRRACKSYEHVGKQIVYDPLGSVIEQSICPWESGTPVITGGEKAHAGEFPHMALIGYGTFPDNYAWNCGGTLISEKFVLTAAHCLFHRLFGDAKFVLLGDLNYTNQNDNQYAQQIDVKRTHKHPNYKILVKYNDIALLELEKSANINLYVKPACLYSKDPKDDIRKASVTGWGYTEDNTPSQHLLKATVDYFTTSECNVTFGHQKRMLPRGIDSNVVICFGSRNSNKDSCQGDSGGPIQVESSTVHCSYDVFGVTSFGKGCGYQNVPAGYAKIYSFIEWIESIVWP